MLSVNNHPLDKTIVLFDQISASGLFELSNYQTWDGSEIARRLFAAGYDRGPGLTRLLAERLASLKCLSQDQSACEHILSTGSRQAVRDLLARVRGVGPRVLDNYLLLRGSTLR